MIKGEKGRSSFILLRIVFFVFQLFKNAHITTKRIITWFTSTRDKFDATQLRVSLFQFCSSGPDPIAVQWPRYKIRQSLRKP